MRKIRGVLIMIILLCIPLLIVSCTNSSENKPNVSESPQENNKPAFKINSEDVSSISVDHKKTIKINKKEDIETIVKILNTNKWDEGIHNSILTIELEIHMNNRSTVIIRFGNGPFMSVEDIGNFALHTEDYSKLKGFI